MACGLFMKEFFGRKIILEGNWYRDSKRFMIPSF